MKVATKELNCVLQILINCHLYNSRGRAIVVGIGIHYGTIRIGSIGHVAELAANMYLIPTWAIKSCKSFLVFEFYAIICKNYIMPILVKK